ncbi:MAG: O-antigen ligase family protein [Blautia sp.]|nr:O-antigen ligase family protein [Blautia sp.]
MLEAREKEEQSGIDVREKLRGAAVEIGNSILTAYFLVMMLFYPLYFENGYQEIGDAKYLFFRNVSLVTVFCMLCVRAVIFVARGKKLSISALYKRMSITDWFAYGYLVLVLFSYVCTPFKEEAFPGAEGWHMGLVSQLLFICLYFLFSRYFKWNDKMPYVMLSGSILVFGLGILNRYSVYPINLGGQTDGRMAIFISTLGNINWFCGYWAVFCAIGAALYWICRSGWQKAAAGVYVVTAFWAGIVQGSNSAYLVLTGIFLFLFCLSFQENRTMRRFLETVLLFLLSCQMARALRYVPGFRVNYESTPGLVLTNTNLTLYLGAAVGIIYLLFYYLTEYKKVQIADYQKMRGAVLLLLASAAAGFVILLILNTLLPEGVRGFSEVPFLIFNDAWAEYRGATWTDGVLTYRSMTLFRKLIGVGPDCFAEYLYTVPELAERVRVQFGSSRLTNAHNEWLTILVNQGILGLICYSGIFISVFIRFVKKAHIRPVLYLFAAAVLTYTLHNMASFQQVLNAPFIFMIMGIGEGIARNS